MGCIEMSQLLLLLCLDQFCAYLLRQAAKILLLVDHHQVLSLLISDCRADFFFVQKHLMLFICGTFYAEIPILVENFYE